MPETPWRQVIQCRDVFGRPSEITVAVLEGDVVLRVPAGEVARFAPHEVDSVKRRLDRAALVAADRAIAAMPTLPVTDRIVIDVRDSDHRIRPLTVGLDRGLVVVQGPGHWRGDRRAVDRVSEALLLRARAAEGQP